MRQIENIQLAGATKSPVKDEKAWTGLGLYGLADWIHCMSGQAEHLWGHQCFLSFALLMWHPGKEWGSFLGLEMYFNRGTVLQGKRWWHWELQPASGSLCFMASVLTSILWFWSSRGNTALGHHGTRGTRESGSVAAWGTFRAVSVSSHWWGAGGYCALPWRTQESMWT